MKTIQFISESIDKMQQLQIPANIQIGTFKVESTGCLINWCGKQGEYNRSKITFTLNFRPDHIQTLMDMGVKIEFNSAVMSGLGTKSKRFKSGREAIKQGRYAPYYYMGDPNNAQTGVIENWLNADASCDINVLKQLDKICRDNHRDEISIHNNTVLSGAGWKIKEHYCRTISIESQYFNIKAIRRNANGKKYESFLPIHKRVLNLK